MNRAQRRALEKSLHEKTRVAARQEKALMETARLGHLVPIYQQLEEIRHYLRGKFPNDFVEQTAGGVVLPKGGVR